jgi:hypothetical protein
MTQALYAHMNNKILKKRTTGIKSKMNASHHVSLDTSEPCEHIKKL